MQRKTEQPKKCANCETLMMRKVYGTRLEDMAVFKRRKFCCLSCANTRKDPKYIGGRARKHLKERCEICGSPNRRQAHHKDRNKANNEPENIQTLCGSCHTALHWREGKTPKPRKYPPNCAVCGKATTRGLCDTHRTRFKRHGNARLVRKKTGSGWRYFEEYGTPNGPAFRELP